MNFLLSDEQLELQNTVLRFATEQCDSACLHRIFDSESGHDVDLWHGLAALGLGGVCIDEAHGGVGLEMIDLALVAEALGRHAVPGPFLGHSLAGLAISLAGSEEQKQKWLPQLASGEKVGTVALGEGEAVWQPDQWRVAASDRIDGRKTFVPCAEAADLVVVGLAGAQLTVVERNAAGVSVEAVDGVDRTRRLSHLAFDGVEFELLPHGPACAGHLRDAALILLAADAYGGASRCVEMAIDYAKLREQFNQPIGKFQALKHQLVNMALEIEPARGLYWYAAHAWNQIPADSPRSAALAKAHLTDRYMQIARDATEAHGGIGYTWEYDLQIWFKRAMFDYAWLGAPAVHRLRAADLAGW